MFPFERYEVVFFFNLYYFDEMLDKWNTTRYSSVTVKKHYYYYFYFNNF